MRFGVHCGAIAIAIGIRIAATLTLAVASPCVGATADFDTDSDTDLDQTLTRCSMAALSMFEPAIEVFAIPFQIGVVLLWASVTLLRQRVTTP